MAEVRLFVFIDLSSGHLKCRHRPNLSILAVPENAIAYFVANAEAQEHRRISPPLELQTSHDVDVVFALTGDVLKNSRAQRQLRVLADIDVHTRVLHLSTGRTTDFRLPHAELLDLGVPPGGSISYFWSVHQKFTNAAADTKARVYHASDLYVLPALASAASKHRAKLVYDARELYPHVASTIGRPWVRHFWRLIEKRFIREADAVFTVSDGIADRLVSMYGVDRPVIVYNVPERPEDHGNRDVKEPVRQRSQKVILHLGQLRPHRGCELLVDAMRDVDGGILVFIGDGPLRDQLKVQALKHHIEGRIHFLDPVPPDEVVAHASTADIGVTLLDDVCLNHRLALPNKLFEYLTAGLPVIASDLPEIRKVVRGFDVGQVVRPGNRNDLVAALQQAILDKSLREQWQSNIPRALETFNWERASQAFLHTYQDVLAIP